MERCKSSSKAAEALKITGEDLIKFNIVDEIIKEPLGGAHQNPKEMAKNLKKSILKALDEFKDMAPEELKEQRCAKYRAMGVFDS